VILNGRRLSDRLGLLVLPLVLDNPAIVFFMAFHDVGGVSRNRGAPIGILFYSMVSKMSVAGRRVEKYFSASENLSIS
jgi:hypothetical protein